MAVGGGRGLIYLSQRGIFNLYLFRKSWYEAVASETQPNVARVASERAGESLQISARSDIRHL